MPIERHIDEYGFETIRFVPSPEQAALLAAMREREAEEDRVRAERQRRRAELRKEREGQRERQERLEGLRAAWQQEQAARKAAGMEPLPIPPELRERRSSAPRPDGMTRWAAQPLEWRKEHSKARYQRKLAQQAGQSAQFLAGFAQVSPVLGNPPEHPNATRARLKREREQQQQQDPDQTPD